MTKDELAAIKARCEKAALWFKKISNKGILKMNVKELIKELKRVKNKDASVVFGTAERGTHGDTDYFLAIVSGVIEGTKEIYLEGSRK